MVAFLQRGCIRQKCFYSGNSCCTWAKWLYSGKDSCSPEKLVVFGQSGCIRAKWLYSCKVVVFGQSGCIRAKVVVLGQICFICAKVAVIRKKWLY